ncbi:MAG TPA: hypothetical protein VFZ34_31030 [Blastocatellia bacterium]|nr:hypothetical protein [Blastocatellia bacterium]
MRFANRHDDAGILPQELDQVYRDVIAAVQLQAYFPTNLIPEIHNWEQAQHYALFTSPQFAY